MIMKGKKGAEWTYIFGIILGIAAVLVVLYFFVYKPYVVGSETWANLPIQQKTIVQAGCIVACNGGPLKEAFCCQKRELGTKKDLTCQSPEIWDNLKNIEEVKSSCPGGFNANSYCKGYTCGTNTAIPTPIDGGTPAP